LSPEEKTRKRFVAKLKQARIYIRTNLLEPAEKNLREIIREAPGTTVAAEAQKELDAMPAH
jgi:predicted Zn-dependent protease